ncbi:ATP-binding protein [Blautia sp. HCP28S3_G10]|uniref:ATP-binding protein n=1 Tax=Blautia sp. HCP28S3_G10 TaxID=3438908 RepID=UPI003F89C5DA
MGKKSSKSSRLIQGGLAVFTVILVILIFMVMHVVSGIQGTARVVNYAGLVRGETQRLIKMEIAGEPHDKKINIIQSYIDGLRNGSDELDFVRMNDEKFQEKMQELDAYFQKLKKEIMLVRQEGYKSTEIISKSEKFFEICDEAVGYAEVYSQKKATALEQFESMIVLDVLCLIILTVVEIIKAIHYAALNRTLQKKVYLDEATGLPNKNKCEEILSDSSLVQVQTGVCVFDLNNLRIINNSMGHEMGDEYIRRFAVLLREAVPEEHFVGRAGGDEFLAVMHGVSDEDMKEILKRIRAHVWKYSENHTDMPISYAAGYALSQEQEDCTMRILFAGADKNMYINKNHMKLEEAAVIRAQNQKLLRKVNALGRSFSDCLYCDAKRDTYRIIRRTEDFFLAKEGNYSGAVEQITEEYVIADDRKNVSTMLRIESLQNIINKDNPVTEVQYQYTDKVKAPYGRITVIFADEDEEGNLHHFLLAFENIHCDYDTADAKQQLTLFYEQMKQSILENENYVDALLETATTVYSVNITDDRVEQNIMRKEEESPQVSLSQLGLELPCSYDEYCRRRVEQVTKETQESYRIVDTSTKLLRRFEMGDKQITVEYKEQNADNTYRWVQKTVLMSENIIYDRDSDQEKKVIYGMVLLKNTTDLHQREQKEMDRLKAAFEEAETANRAKTDFLSRMSHDIRTPINGVMGMLQIISKNREDHQKVDDCLEKIHISAEHLLALINDVLDMSKLEAGKVELEHVSFGLDSVLKVTQALNDAQIAQTGITYTSHEYELKHTRLVGSPLHLRQILLNLFNNAMKYNKLSGTIDTYVRELSSDSQNAVFEFRIVDTGIGMRHEFVEHELFKPFTQEKLDSARTEYGGTGLGMAIVRELIEKMGGSITVESEPDEGSTFTVVIPFEIDSSPIVNNPSDELDSVSEDLSGLKVLLAEDNHLNMEIAEFMLTDNGAVVTKAWNGKEALDIFRQSEPGEFNMIMLDIMMPVMDGLESAREIRNLNRPDAKTIPIVAMTANAFLDDIRRSREAGMNEHLSKPLDMQKVAQTVYRFCKTK